MTPKPTLALDADAIARCIKRIAHEIAEHREGGAGKLGSAGRITAGKRDHLAARVGAECRQLHGTSVIGADNA